MILAIHSALPSVSVSLRLQIVPNRSQGQQRLIGSAMHQAKYETADQSRVRFAAHRTRALDRSGQPSGTSNYERTAQSERFY